MSIDKKEIRKLFGARIRQLRLSKKMSQDDVYSKCGVTKSYQSLIESGQARVTIDTIKSLSEGLGVRISELFEFDLSTDSIDKLKVRLKKTLDESRSDVRPEELYKDLLSDLFNL